MNIDVVFDAYKQYEIEVRDAKDRRDSVLKGHRTYLNYPLPGRKARSDRLEIMGAKLLKHILIMGYDGSGELWLLPDGIDYNDTREFLDSWDDDDIT